MQNFARRLMSGASLALLAVGGGLASGTARAGGVTIAGFTTANVTTPVPVDFIYIHGGGIVTGDVTNESLVGPHEFAINVDGAAGTAFIGGNITNVFGAIVGSSKFEARGIYIHGSSATLVGNILNDHGAVIIAHASHATGGAVAIDITGDAHVGGHIVNSGQIHAYGTGSDEYGVFAGGVYESRDSALVAHTDINATGALLRAQAVLHSGVIASAAAYELRVFNNISAEFANYGVVKASATASYADFGARAAGVVISNDGASANVNQYGKVFNDGSILVHAKASFASIVSAAGVYLDIEGDGGASNHAHAIVTNDGLIQVSAKGVDVDSVQARGVMATAAFAHSATVHVVNNGKISVAAANSTFLDDSARAFAIGVGEVADPNTAGGVARNQFVNNGTLNVHAFAVAEFDADATATGVRQTGEHAKTAYNSVTNNGKIHVWASASGEYPDANARGIVQSEISVTGAYENKFVNHGSVQITAYAKDVSGEAYANATGVGQGAHIAMGGCHTEDCHGEDPLNKVTNNGVFLDNATAIGGFASAHAKGFVQDIAGFASARNDIVNDGVLVAAASAQAPAHGFAAAHASAAIQAINSAAVASNTVINDGLMVAQAQAHAGTSGEAFAYAHGVKQAIDSAGTGYQSVRNYGQTEGVGSTAHFVRASMEVQATAVAGKDGRAEASAVAISQKQFFVASTAKNYVSNDGNIFASARAGGTAHATGVEATATAIDVAQRASNAFEIINSAVNHSGAEMVALASAKGGAADAHASGIRQVASDAYGAGNYVTNDGVIAVSAVAVATKGDADAEARGVQQVATEVVYAVNSVSNSGLIAAKAKASGHEYATAYGTAVLQHNSASAEAHNYVGNGGTIAAKASAVADVDNARASAWGIAQGAFASSVAQNQVSNNGYIRASAVAKAGGSAYAEAYGIEQEAGASGTAQNIVKNYGYITAVAHANGGGDDVEAYAYGVSQNAGAFDTAANSLLNDGRIFASAVATGLNHAEAEAYGAYQSAHASGVDNNVATNGSSAEIIAKAKAISVDDDADAYAYGIYQYGDTAAEASNKFLNYGYVWAQASATAAFGAEAEAYGAYQYAKASVTAHNVVTNYGTIAAKAKAISTSSDAYAYAYGVGQEAEGNVASNFLYNDGYIEAAAAASAEYAAYADADGFYQYAYGSKSAINVATNEWVIDAKANAIAYLGDAYAYAYGGYQYASEALTKAQNVFYNYGDVSAGASADASEVAVAKAYGIDQIADASGSAINYVYNDGYIEAAAYADGGSRASANAYGVEQSAKAFGYAANTVINYGYIRAVATAEAGGHASASAVGVKQSAAASITAHNFVSNHGTIEATAKAYDADLSATANAGGVLQQASGYFAGNAVYNNGYISAHAYASAYGAANASAIGVGQNASGVYADNSVINDGRIHAVATAYGYTYADAGAIGVAQFAGAESAAVNYVSNGVHGRITASARAYAFDGLTKAEASAQAVGIAQFAESPGFTVEDIVINNGRIYAFASAVAASAPKAHAVASAFGVEQELLALTTVLARVHNHGTIVAGAYAAAYNATSATAHAEAIAVGIEASAPAVYVDVTNAGYIDAYADAYDAGHASAYAVGVGVIGNVVLGTIANDGEIYASAYAPGGKAQAVGIGVKANQFIGEIFNGGRIAVYATGKTAVASAIAVGSNGVPVGTGLGLIVNDGGSIYAEANGKAGWAINVTGAPNPVDIDLEGSGTIQGNIGIQAADKITVVNGKTFFDGTVNPGAIGKVGTLTVDAGATLWLANAPTSVWGNNAIVNVNAYNQPGILELNVDSANVGGIATHNGQIYANTADLTGGSVVLNPSTGLYPTTITYRVVFGALGGTTWTGGGPTFAPGSAINPTSPLFSLAYSYPNPAEGDITMTMTPFNLVPGLTPNEKGVATGLEGGYSTTLTGGAAALYESIFLLSGAQYPKALDSLSGEEEGELAFLNVNFARDFMDMLSTHVGTVQSAGAAMASLSQPLQLASNATAIPADASQGGVPPDPALWGAGFGSWSTVSSTISGPGYHNVHGGISAGYDIYSDQTFLVGIAAAYTPRSDVTYQAYGTSGSSPIGSVAARGSVEGFEVGAYGRYDSPDNLFYLAGNFAYGNYDDRANRFVILPTPGGGGATYTSGWLSSKFTSDVWSLYAEGGLPFVIAPQTKLTPYVGIAYINSDSGAYTESGSLGGGIGTAADLAVSDASSTSVQSYLGGQLTTTWTVDTDTTLLPSLRVAWAHEFESDIWNVNAAFSGIPGSTFGPVTGGALAKNYVIVDADMGAAITGDISATLGYEGRFSDTNTNNLIFGRLDIALP